MRKITFIVFTVFLNSVFFSCTPDSLVEPVIEQACCGDDILIPPPPPPPPPDGD